MIIEYILCDRCGHVAKRPELIHDHILHKNKYLCESCAKIFDQQVDAIPCVTTKYGNKIPQDMAQLEMITHMFSSKKEEKR